MNYNMNDVLIGTERNIRKKILNLFHLFLFLGIFCNTWGDIIQGTITDMENGAPIESVKVALQKNSQVYTYTKKSGTYKLDTDITGITQNTAGMKWNTMSLFTMFQNLENGVLLKVRNAKGALIGEHVLNTDNRNFKRFFSSYPMGLYVLSMKTATAVTHFWICKLDPQTYLIKNKINGHSIQKTFFRNGAATEDHVLLYSKPGYRDTTQTVTGSQNNVNLQLKRVPFCGNSIVETGEVCDGNTMPCNLIDPMRYAAGDAQCNDSCSGFKHDACIEHPIIDVSSNPNGKYHRKAAEITGKAQLNVIFRAQAGMIEGDIQTIIDSVFNANGSSGLAFPHITGSGPNSLILHYTGKNRKLQDGDVLLVDIGAKYNGYCGDITRTYPVSGKFTPRQREIYQLVLDAQKAAAAEMKPNKQSLKEMTTFVKGFFRKSPLRAKDENGVERTMDYFFIHGLSHYIGKKVHGEDLGFSTSEPVKPGRIFSIEPGIYIKSEGFGVRLEDDFLMTSKGAVNIFPNTPIEIDQIEALMAQRKLSETPVHYQDVYPESNEKNDHMDF